MLLKIIFSCVKDSYLVAEVGSVKYASKLKSFMFSRVRLVYCKAREALTTVTIDRVGFQS